jgi:hypothetical protein
MNVVMATIVTEYSSYEWTLLRVGSRVKPPLSEHLLTWVHPMLSCFGYNFFILLLSTLW